MVSVPYALEAANAQTLGGLPASAFLKTGSAAGINDFWRIRSNPGL